MHNPSNYLKYYAILLRASPVCLQLHRGGMMSNCLQRPDIDCLGNRGYITPMADRARFTIPILLALGLGVFLPGINWGLPSRSVDRFLFGDHEIWPGRKIL